MRGVVSLATALALSQDTPERNLLVFLAFVVILVTLVGQGLSLPLLTRALGVGVDRGAAMLHPHERGKINDQVWREIERDLDLEETRKDTRDAREA